MHRAIAHALAQAKSYDLPRVCISLGLAPGEDSEASASKSKYVVVRTKDLPPQQLYLLACRVFQQFPTADLQEGIDLHLQGSQSAFSAYTRRKILQLFLERENLSGALDMPDFLERVQTMSGPSKWDHRSVSAYSEAVQHTVSNPGDWTDQFVLEQYLEIVSCSDARFTRLLDAYVHPLVRDGGDQQAAVEEINQIIEADGYKLQECGVMSRQPIFRVHSIRTGVDGSPKNLIFAANGPKPDLVLVDAVNNDIRIIRNAEYCLVYSEEIPVSGLTWRRLVSWWADREGRAPDRHAEKSLFERLRTSLQSPPELVLFETYSRFFRKSVGLDMPALIPQVYLHFDPKTLSERVHGKVIPRQRMDFLMLLSPHERIVLEVDGRQHYSDALGSADPKLYAEMVAADRDLRLTGYEVYRFGAAELMGDHGARLVEAFFIRLFQQHSLAP